MLHQQGRTCGRPVTCWVAAVCRSVSIRPSHRGGSLRVAMRYGLPRPSVRRCPCGSSPTWCDGSPSGAMWQCPCRPWSAWRRWCATREKHSVQNASTKRPRLPHPAGSCRKTDLRGLGWCCLCGRGLAASSFCQRPHRCSPPVPSPFVHGIVRRQWSLGGESFFVPQHSSCSGRSPIGCHQRRKARLRLVQPSDQP